MSSIGAEFTRERFLRTPISTIRWLLTELDDHEKEQANISSITTAQLAALVVQIAHAYSGSKSKSPAANPVSFLPYADWRPSGAKEGAGPDKATQMVLAELGGQRRLPVHVLAALLTPVEQRA